MKRGTADCDVAMAMTLAPALFPVAPLGLRAQVMEPLSYREFLSALYRFITQAYLRLHLCSCYPQGD